MSSKLIKAELSKIFAITLIFTILISISMNAASIINPVVSLSGKIFDKKSNLPIQSNIIVKDEEGKTIYKGKSNKNTGFYLISGLKPEAKYTISISVNEFASKEVVDFSAPKADKYLEIEKNIYVNADFVAN